MSLKSFTVAKSLYVSIIGTRQQISMFQVRGRRLGLMIDGQIWVGKWTWSVFGHTWARTVIAGIIITGVADEIFS